MRTFIAIPFNPEIIQKMTEIRKELKTGIKRGVTWADPSKTHLTLKFLGEIEVNQVVQINKVLAAISRDSFNFEIYCTGIGCFPDFRQPRIIWVGIKQEQRLFALHSLIESACYSAGFPKEEKKFSPHLTLGRIRESLTPSDLEYLQEIGNKEQEMQPVSLAVDEIILFRSQLFQSGPVYSQISAFKLQKNPI
jgi:RNA 2',3'-cyclic 3'-phosphodiesterase